MTYISQFSAFCLRPTLKNWWFAVLLPTHQKLALPKFFWPFWRNFFCCCKKPFTFTTIFLSQILFSVVLKYYIFMDSILDHILSTVKEKVYPIKKQNKKQKKTKQTYLPTYLPILKLMGWSTANKKYFKDGLITGRFWDGEMSDLDNNFHVTRWLT